MQEAADGGASQARGTFRAPAMLRGESFSFRGGTEALVVLTTGCQSSRGVSARGVLLKQRRTCVSGGERPVVGVGPRCAFSVHEISKL